ncbi:GD17801 [Drosophila simulans]|uniref:GD17801 n=1 Tax=Drosophila simulans TaxID=7240 RepID=B4QAI1_DROSI|nr:GD17801 [Drosophila simulans]
MFNKPKRLNKERQAKNSHFESEPKGKAILMELSGK